MEYYTSEKEQVETLKQWWKNNGRPLVLGLVLGIGALAAYRYWDNVQTARAESASVTYEQLMRLLSEQRLDDARKVGEAIVETYPDSVYARLSTLLLARLAVDAGDDAAARAHLAPLAAADDDSEIGAIARARLARLALADGDTAEAAHLVASLPVTAQGERFTELRADVLAAQGDVDGARAMYGKALAAAAALGLDGAAIQLKLDNLDGARKDSDS